MDDIKHGDLTIQFLEGANRPELENNILRIYTYIEGYDDFKKSDLYLDDYIIQISTSWREPNGSFDYQTNYYVLDMGVWNWRTYKDISVIKHLERLNVHRIPKNERHNLHLEFGRTELGTQALTSLVEIFQKEFFILDNSLPIKLRNWDHYNELFLTILKTKLKIQTSTEQLKRIENLLLSQGYENEAHYLQSQLLKSLVEQCDISINFKDNFKKTSKKQNTNKSP